jgi:uncharacterized protein (TIGR03437 family)
VAVDRQGNLFIADRTNNRVRRVDAQTGTISLAAGTGRFGDDFDGRRAEQARLRFPMGLAADPQGRVYFSDNANNRVKLLTPFTEGPTEALTDPPAIRTDGGVATDTAFGASVAIAPGAWIEIYGEHFAASEREWQSEDFAAGRAPLALEGTAVSVNGLAAPVSYVSPNMIRALVPLDLQGTQAKIAVETPAGRSRDYWTQVDPAAAGIHAPANLRLAGRQFAAALIEDADAYALPENSTPDVAARPARPGEVLVLYGTGFGPVTPHVETGEIPAGQTKLVNSLEVRIGGMPADILAAGLAPGKAGLYEIRVVVPPLAEAGAVPLEMRLNGKPLLQDLYVAVEP